MKYALIFILFIYSVVSGQTKIDKHTDGYSVVSPGLIVSDTSRCSVSLTEAVSKSDSLAGWRLPTISELKIIFSLKTVKVDPGYYWSADQESESVQRLARMWGRFAVVAGDRFNDRKCVRLVKDVK